MRATTKGRFVPQHGIFFRQMPTQSPPCAICDIDGRFSQKLPLANAFRGPWSMTWIRAFRQALSLPKPRQPKHHRPRWMAGQAAARILKWPIPSIYPSAEICGWGGANGMQMLWRASSAGINCCHASPFDHVRRFRIADALSRLCLSNLARRWNSHRGLAGWHTVDREPVVRSRLPVRFRSAS